MVEEKTCKTCKHFGQCDHEGWGTCNVQSTKDTPRLVAVKQMSPACESYWDDEDGQFWRDGFGFSYRYDWQSNSFICDDNGQVLSLEYKELLISTENTKFKNR